MSSWPPEHWTGPDYAADDERAARRVVWFLAVSVGVLVVGLVTMLAYRQVQDRRSDADRPAADGSGASRGGTDLELASEVGPRPGVEVAAYLEERNAALGLATGDLLAVASFSLYMSEGEARGLANEAGLEVGAALAAVPGGVPQLVEESMAVWVREQRAGLEEERRELVRILPTVESAAFRQEYEAEIARLDARLERIGFDSDLVFGLVVRGPAEAMRSLAEDPAVRLVDVAPPGASPSRYGGLRPEEATRAAEPPGRPSAE